MSTYESEDSVEQGPVGHRARGLGSAFWRLLFGQQIALAPQAMAPIAFGIATLSMSERFNVGAAMVSAMTLCQVVFAVPLSRLGRLVEPARFLRWMLAGRALAFLSMTLASSLHASADVLIPAAALTGMANGTIFASYRLLLSNTVSAARLPRAVALSATANELVFVVSPVVAALLGVASAALPLALMTLAAAAPAILPLPSEPLDRRPQTRMTIGHLSPALSIWLLCYLSSATATSTIEVGAVALALRFGLTAPYAAVFTLSLCVASVLGGAVLTFFGRSPGHRSVLALLAFSMVGAFTLGAARQVWVATLGCALIGLCLAPLGTFYSLVTEQLTSGHRRGEGFSLLRMAQGVGVIISALLVTFLDVATASALAAALLLLSVIIVASTRSYHAGQVLQPDQNPGS